MAALPLIVFDVNETLLDLETMEPTFQRIFRDKSAMRLWFANFIMYSAALTVAGCYVPFTDIGSAVMKMLADTRGIKINDKDRRNSLQCRLIPRFRRRYESCATQVFGSSRSRTICSKFRPGSSSMAASSICSNEDLARTASSTINRRARLTLMLRESLALSLPSFVS